MTITVGARLSAYLQVKKRPVTDFVAQVGVSYESFRRWTAGETSPNRKRVKRIAEILGCSEEWVTFGSGNPPADLSASDAFELGFLSSGTGSSLDELPKPPITGAGTSAPLTETVTSGRRGVPVRGTVVTGENDVVDVSPLERDPIGWVSGLTSEGAYALRIKGDGLWPVIEAESFIVVEPSLPPKNGQKVLITLRDGRRLIKKLQYATDEAVSVTSIKTGAPQTFDALAIEIVHSIGSVVEAARWERAN